MREAAIAFLHTQVASAVPSGADFYDAARSVDIEERLQSQRPWVKLYLPSEEGDRHPVEMFLVTIDCGAPHAEAARATADAVRTALATTRRTPSPWTRRRIVGLDGGNYYRVQLTYSVARPALT